MKKIMLSFFISAVALVSCSKDETGTTSSTTEVISVSATPSTIIKYVSENYPDASISVVLKYSNSDTSYAISLNTYEFLAFHDNGSLIGECLSDTLCDSIPHPEGNGHHGGGHHGSGHHGGGHHDGGIPADSIPAVITDYIAANFVGYTIHNAMYDTLCQFGIVMNVMIDSSHSAHHKLIFTTSGTYLATANRILSADLPAAVTAVLTANYATYTLREKAEKLTLSDNSVQYRVFMRLDSVRKSVVFKEDGTVICED